MKDLLVFRVKVDVICVKQEVELFSLAQNVKNSAAKIILFVFVKIVNDKFLKIA
jgi:hypothetical protein